MKIKKIILSIVLFIIIVALIVFVIIGKNITKTQNDTGKIKIVASNFASYDFIRQIIGDSSKFQLTFLLGPGKDAHTYDPTAQDIITIQNSDMFVYIGGEMEKWAPKVLEGLDMNKKTVICIADSVKTIQEQKIDGAEPEADDDDNVQGAFDEHIWTSPENAEKMVASLEQQIEKLDPSNSSKYETNSQVYINQIKDVDNQIQNVLNNKVRNRLVFGDKMPMQYFMNYYKLDVSAAFSGCSTEVEPSASTIAYLVNKVKEENIPVVLYTELNDSKVAQTICDEAGNNAKAVKIQTLHNVSQNEFNSGATWVSLMQSNVEVLKEALDK